MMIGLGFMMMHGLWHTMGRKRLIVSQLQKTVLRFLLGDMALEYM